MQVLSSRVLLRPTDCDAAVAFYEGGIGLVRFREWGRPGHRGVVYFLGGGHLELTETAAGTKPHGVRLWLQVADRGVAISAEPERKPWGLIELSVHDPDGLELVVIETPLDHPLRRRA